MGRGPVVLALAFTVVELACFLGVAFLAQSDAPFSWSRVAAALLPHVGSALGCIATTWYVVFTYFILKATDNARRQASEPYVTVQWTSGPAAGDHSFPSMGELSTKAITALQPLIGTRYVPSDHPARFLNLEIQNVRSTPVGWIKIEAEATWRGSLGTSRLDEKTDLVWSMENASLERNRTLRITALDLGGIPEATKVTVRIVRINYRPVDSLVILDASGGVEHYEAAGVANYSTAIQTQPKIAGGDS